MEEVFSSSSLKRGDEEKLFGQSLEEAVQYLTAQKAYFSEKELRLTTMLAAIGRTIDPVSIIERLSRSIEKEAEAKGCVVVGCVDGERLFSKKETVASETKLLELSLIHI